MDGDTMKDNGYVPLMWYKGQQVLYDRLGNKVLIERSNGFLQAPLPEERKPLIDEGLVRILNEILNQVLA